MKTRIIFITIALILASGSLIIMTAQDEDTGKNISILCPEEFQDLASVWVRGFSAENTNADIGIITSNPDDIPGKLTDNQVLALVPESSLKTIKGTSFWSMTVGREIIVAVINPDNPAINQIRSCGLSANELAGLIANPDNTSWLSLVENGPDKRVNVYLPSGEAINEAIKLFAGANSLHGIKTTDVLNAVSNDPFAIGFCNFTDIIDPANNEISSGISLLPIDKNANGKIDHFENIYNNANDFTRGVWIGKYPSALISNLYLVSHQIPESEILVNFIRFTLASGQKSLGDFGYNGLVYAERQGNLEEFNARDNIQLANSGERYAVQKIILIVIALVIAGGIAANVFIRRRWNRSEAPVKKANEPRVVSEQSLNIPNGLYFDKSHTWAFMEKDGTVKVGIDDFLQHITGNYTRIIMKDPGESVKKNDQFITLVQDGKQLNIYSPVSGKIVAINKNLKAHPSLINSSPYEAGWLYKIEPSNWLREIQFLLMGMKYREWVRKEFQRVKDFLTASVNTNPDYAAIAMQDGGELRNNILGELDPRTWEDFQKNFIDICD